MNILTFDIEDWYNCDFISQDFDWDKYEVRIYEGVDRILDILAEKKLKGSFFCLGWLAEKHPNVIKKIHEQGHDIGSHSYQHELAYRFDKKEFLIDTEKSIKLLEDVIGEKVKMFRAPGFSITNQNLWAFDILAELGIEYDASILPAHHEYGGFTSFGKAEPAILDIHGYKMKEFPTSPGHLFSKDIIFSGGGYFRLFPYSLIKYLMNQQEEYVMTYFHPRDFDADQPVIKSLPFHRKFKSYVGLKTAFSKFERLLDDFEFTSISGADEVIDWDAVRTIKL